MTIAQNAAFTAFLSYLSDVETAAIMNVLAQHLENEEYNDEDPAPEATRAKPGHKLLVAMHALTAESLIP